MRCPESGPCPLYTCRFHLGVDVVKRKVRVLIDPDTIDTYDGPTCAIEVAAGGPRSLREVAEIMGGLSRERVRTIADEAMAKLRAVVDDPR